MLVFIAPRCAAAVYRRGNSILFTMDFLVFSRYKTRGFGRKFYCIASEEGFLSVAT